jgi:hypothetical protein
MQALILNMFKLSNKTLNRNRSRNIEMLKISQFLFFFFFFFFFFKISQFQEKARGIPFGYNLKHRLFFFETGKDISRTCFISYINLI